jgi:hypothetical protein
MTATRRINRSAIHSTGGLLRHGFATGARASREGRDCRFCRGTECRVVNVRAWRGFLSLARPGRPFGTAGPPGNFLRLQIANETSRLETRSTDRGSVGDRPQRSRSRLGRRPATTKSRTGGADDLKPQTAIEVPPGGRDLLDSTRAAGLDQALTLHYKVMRGHKISDKAAPPGRESARGRVLGPPAHISPHRRTGWGRGLCRFRALDGSSK